jgi:hypothetical protein
MITPASLTHTVWPRELGSSLKGQPHVVGIQKSIQQKNPEQGHKNIEKRYDPVVEDMSDSRAV